ncbi:MAG TPA: hypothetical protein VD926_14155 [Acidimicrobiales bacterium]|nr:hypothetical protein [Acidimicrobiales bacterium]
MAGYDPKQKRAHSPTSDDQRAPVDDLLGPPPVPVDDPDVEPATVGPEVAERPVPVPDPQRPLLAPPAPASSGPGPRVLVLAGAALAAVLVWRWRRR